MQYDAMVAGNKGGSGFEASCKNVPENFLARGARILGNLLRNKRTFFAKKTFSDPDAAQLQRTRFSHSCLVFSNAHSVVVLREKAMTVI